MRLAMRFSMFHTAWTVGQIKFPMTQSDKWTWDRAKLIDPRFVPARDVSGPRLYFASD
jgi:hypothetical protein